MNLRHIYAFITVAEELHFRHAAKRLNVGESPFRAPSASWKPSWA